MSEEVDYYTTTGAISGPCGRRYKRLTNVERYRSRKAHHSDRYIVAVLKNGQTRTLTDEEFRLVLAYINQRTEKEKAT